MSRAVLITCLAATWLFSTPALAEPPPYDHARVMSFVDVQGNARDVKTPAEWSVRRKHVLLGMEQAMGSLPASARTAPLDVRIEMQAVAGKGYDRFTLTYSSGDSNRVPAWLYVPTGLKPGERRAGILALHPTSPLGKGIVDGQGPKANRGYAKELAERGYVVLAPDYPSFGEYDYDFAKDDYVSGTMKGIVNHLRGVTLLAERPEVDAQRLGVIGHSLGGHNAMFVAAFDERLKAVVSSCGWTPFANYYGGKLDGWTSERYMPLIKSKYGLDPQRVPFEFQELVAALAPRAFFSNSPLRDGNFDVTGVREAVAESKRVYELLKAADKLQVRYPDSDHDFVPEVREESYRFLDRELSRN